MSRNALPIATLLLCGAAVAYAQETAYYVPTIVAEGEAQAETPVQSLVFGVSFKANSPNAEEALTAIDEKRKALEESIQTLSPPAASAEFRYRRVEQEPSGHAYTTRFSVYLTFNARPAGDNPDPAAHFAAIRGQIEAWSKSEGGNLHEDYDALPANPGAAEKQAIAEAVKNAYPKAAAAAETLKTRIVAVKEIAVQEVAWPKDVKHLTARKSPPDSLACRASVRVTYVYEESY